ncbi:uncharacterized protein SAPINGB_P006132 [Magnusiomyces paraingens]|uniref:Protein BOI2 n=1 Tax=Magnusiomyces paraingens TaxID=2606893 RepID=A0A5E8C5E4_9ASCO|nr:uncharacterized protein SAPINGB_P006132 [Saprochaete ingens]VVT58290.1 unnamed protein product [Saprochaete ingens]
MSTAFQNLAPPLQDLQQHQHNQMQQQQQQQQQQYTGSQEDLSSPDLIYLIVLHDFESRSDDELTMRKGDHILVLETDQAFNDGWYIGRNLSTKQAGMFPYSFTTRLVLPTPAPLNSPTNILTVSPLDSAGSSSSLPLDNNNNNNKSRINHLKTNNNTITNNSINQQPSPSSSSNSLPYASIQHPSDSVHDTLTDIDEAISEFASANASYDNVLSHQQLPRSNTPQQQRHHYSQLGTTNSPVAYLPTTAAPFPSSYDSNTSRSSSISVPTVATPPPPNLPQNMSDILSWTPLQVKTYFLSQGYEPAVCECFLRHQITGPILLELDLAYLKEIDIPSFGTRFQISKVIKSLNAMLKQDTSDSKRENSYNQAIATTTTSPTAASSSGNHNGSNNSNGGENGGLMAPPVFKRQSVLRTAKDNAYLNDYLSKQGLSYPQDSSDFDFPLKGDDSIYKPSPQSSSQQMHQYHKKDASFDRNWKVPQMSEKSNSDLGSSSSYVEESRIRHGSNSHVRQMSNDTIRGGGGGSGGGSGDGGSTLYSHKHSHSSSSSAGLSDFKYLNKFSTDDHNSPILRANSVPEVVTANDDEPVDQAVAAAAAAAAATTTTTDIEDTSKTDEATPPSEEEDKRMMTTDPTLSNTSFGSSDSNPQRTSTGGFLKKKSMRSSSSQSNLRKSSSKKQATSAFLEGIKRITPEEAKKTADFSGWMSKRGSATVGTWKARYFTLHGTRLSYFTSLNDTREKGLIDITSHRVVAVGDDDKLVAIYAASVGAGRHCFKVVPPSPGSRKGVTFTVPKVHYFAVETADEMREWMNALMKATIDRDDSKPVVSSCATPTVSLARAREMFAEARVREEELRAKAIAEGGNGANNWFPGISGVNHHTPLSSSPDILGTPSTPDSPSRSLSLRSDTGSSITGSVLRHHVPGTGSPASPFSSGLPAGVTAALANHNFTAASSSTPAVGSEYYGSPNSGATAATTGTTGTATTAATSATGQSYGTLAESSSESGDDLRHLTAKTAGLRIVTDLS